MKKLSPVQLEVLRRMVETDAPLVRLDGGFWTTLGTENREDRPEPVPVWYVTVHTLHAMERQGLLKRAYQLDEEWRDWRNITPEGRARAQVHQQPVHRTGDKS